MKEKEQLRKNEFMRNKRSFIFLLILCLGVGFAFLSSQLTITGNTSVSGNKWSVYFSNVQVSDGSVDATVEPTTTGTTTTSINYTVLLDKPGDFYEFTVDAVNAGTIDAMIDTITTPNIDSRVLQYVSYSATYEDGSALQQNDVLKKNKTTTYKVRVEYKKNIEATDLDEEGVNLTLTFGVNYVQSTIKPVVSQFVKMVNKSAISDSAINFSQISSASNGEGLYVRSGTEEDDYPIYYYRGAVTNNNAKFAGFCWKIVRTTETGGTKLIYNGLPDGNGQCVNTTGNATQLSTTSTFNSSASEPIYAGYMYGTSYSPKYLGVTTKYLFGASFSYSDGTYTLNDINNGVNSTHHYTCFNSTGTCSELSYVYSVLNTSSHYYITLTDGKDIETALAEMKVNTTDSTIKTAIDSWFTETFNLYFTNLNKRYNDYLEDTIWCNDRSMNTLGSNQTYINNGWISDGGSVSNFLYYSPYGRLAIGSPRMDCPNKNDAFTVTESASGNGALTYPVGLLTTDEIMLAGGNFSKNTSYYLYTNKSWWTMAPHSFYDTSTEGWGYWGIGNFGVASDGSAYKYVARSDYGVRPSISLKPTVKIREGGDGTSTSPYEFVVE